MPMALGNSCRQSENNKEPCIDLTISWEEEYRAIACSRIVVEHHFAVAHVCWLEA